MIPYKYNYYIGRLVNIAFGKGYVDPQTGQTSISDDFYSSSYMDLTGLKAIYLNCGCPVSVVFFTNAYSVVKAIQLNNNDSCIQIPNGSAYAIFTYSKDCLDFMRLYESTEPFIYGLTTCEPHYKDLIKKYTKESNQEFFRISLDGKITLFGYDYEFVANTSIESMLVFIIEYDSKVYFRGSFNKADCSIDYSKKSCELKLTPLDDYTKVLDAYDNEYDLIKLAPALTPSIRVAKRPIAQVYISGGNTISNFFGGTYWEDDVLEPISEHKDLLEKYHFSYLMAANELNVHGADDPDLNGVYAGVNGEYVSFNGKYKITFSAPPNESGQQTFAFIGIRQTSNNEVLYESRIPYGGPWGDEVDDYMYFDPGDISSIEFVPLKTSGRTDKFSASVYLYQVYKRIICDVDSFQDGSVTKQTYDIPLDDFVADNRNYKKCIGSTSGQFLCSPIISKKPTKYGINDYGDYFSNNFVGAWAYRPLPVCRSAWVNAAMWFVNESIDNYSNIDSKLRKNYILKDSYSLDAVINVLLEKIDPTLTHEGTEEYSKFFYAPEFPLDSTQSRFYLHITPKSNILKSEYDQPAQKAEITFKNFMDMLRDCFRCYWYIENKKFKIEHISFFMNGGSYNKDTNYFGYTELKDQFNKIPISYFQSQLSYNKNELPGRYEFNWADNATELFTGPNVNIKSGYVQKDKIESISTSLFSSDIDFMLFNPDDFSEDGFALLCPVMRLHRLVLPINTVQLIDDQGFSYYAIAQNFYASWKYLLRYYMYDMPSKNLSIDEGIKYTCKSIKRSMLHNIKMQVTPDFDMTKLIRTDVGDGVIDSLSVNLNTRVADISVAYEPK